MKKTFRFMLIFCCLTLLSLASISVQGQDPPRLKRSDSFLGIHLDFHARTTDKNIGQNTTPEMVNTLLDIVRPDYIQIDCKGHSGCCSYPTKVGNHSDNFVGDPLKVWRQVTAKRGVALYMHYSGIWDNIAVAKHPDWAVQDSSGKSSDRITSVFGPYADSLLIPQMLELANIYDVDGAWIDGECWAQQLDYSAKAKQAFTATTGKTVIPTKPDAPNWFEWCQFHREAFRQYLRHYIEEIHRQAPKFQIASNWSFTDHMPEPVSAPVDFISGDYTSGNSVNAARYSSRFMQTQGISWDLMAWSFDYSDGPGKKKGNKTGIQLQREAACVLAQGGGFQAYYTQNRDGSIDLNKVKTMGEAARFCRERQNVCFRSIAVPQVALLLPTSAHYKRISDGGGSLYPWATQWQRNILNPLLENHFSVEIYNDTPKFLKNLDVFKTIVIAEWTTLDQNTIDAVCQYVKHGGNLLLIGEKTIALFDKLVTNVSKTKLENVPAGYTVEIVPCQSGRVALIPNALSDQYNKQREEVRTVYREAMRAIFPNPIVQIDGSPFVDVSIRRTQTGLLSIHLVNTSGPHEMAGVLETIDPIGPLTIAINAKTKPNALFLEPGHRTVDYVYKNGQIKLTLDKLAIHDIIVIDDLTK